MFTNHVNSATHRLSVQDLWICLICGHVGCGRYRAKHSIDHWRDSGHVYALELETQRVWDYVGDGYVHRLIQSKTDGKLVEVPSPAPAAASSRAATEDRCSSYAPPQSGSWLCSRCAEGQSACSTQMSANDLTQTSRLAYQLWIISVMHVSGTRGHVLQGTGEWSSRP